MVSFQDDYSPAGQGECDECHKQRSLFWYHDDEPGDWRYCGACAVRDARRRDREEQRWARRNMAAELDRVRTGIARGEAWISHGAAVRLVRLAAALH